MAPSIPDAEAIDLIIATYNRYGIGGRFLSELENIVELTGRELESDD